MINNGSQGNAKQLQAKVAEDFSKNCFTDDHCGKSDDDGTTAHIDIRKTLILTEHGTGKRYQAIGYHESGEHGSVRVDSLRARHFIVAAGCA